MNYLNNIERLLIEAGSLIIAVKNRNVSLKDDGSPVTAADIASNNHLCKHLPQIIRAPIVSEECDKVDIKALVPRYWLLDPLDGTKEYVAGSSEYCICVSLIENGIPQLGAIYCPELNEFYYAERGRGIVAKSMGQDLIPSSKRIGPLKVAVSRYHHSEESENFIRSFGDVETIVTGSAIKFGRLSTGQLDVYPRLEGSKSWDISAGHCILTESGGTLQNISNGFEPRYLDPYEPMEHFIAKACGVSLISEGLR